MSSEAIEIGTISKLFEPVSLKDMQASLKMLRRFRNIYFRRILSKVEDYLGDKDVLRGLF